MQTNGLPVRPRFRMRLRKRLEPPVRLRCEIQWVAVHGIRQTPRIRERDKPITDSVLWSSRAIGKTSGPHQWHDILDMLRNAGGHARPKNSRFLINAPT